jgi:hypothetical protein
MYSADFKRLAMRIYHEKKSFKKTAVHMKVSPSTVLCWYRELYTVKKKSTQRVRRKVTDEIVKTLSNFVTTNQVALLRDMRACIQSKHNTLLHRHTLANVLKRECGMSRKRTSKRFAGAATVNPTLVGVFETKLKEYVTEGRTFVSLDECYFSEKVLPLYGYSPKGQKCVIHAPKSCWKQRSLLLGIASDGSFHRRIYDGALNKVRFQEYIESLPYSPGSVVILDNVAFHKDVTILERRGFIPLFTPPYSPQYNPVEIAFSVTKQVFRQMWPWQTGIENSIDAALKRLTPTHIMNMFAHVFAL